MEGRTPGLSTATLERRLARLERQSQPGVYLLLAYVTEEGEVVAYHDGMKGGEITEPEIERLCNLGYQCFIRGVPAEWMHV